MGVRSRTNRNAKDLHEWESNDERRGGGVERRRRFERVLTMRSGRASDDRAVYAGQRTRRPTLTFGAVQRDIHLPSTAGEQHWDTHEAARSAHYRFSRRALVALSVALLCAMGRAARPRRRRRAGSCAWQTSPRNWARETHPMCRLCESGELPHLRVVNSIRIRRQDLAEYVTGGPRSRGQSR